LWTSVGTTWLATEIGETTEYRQGPPPGLQVSNDGVLGGIPEAFRAFVGALAVRGRSGGPGGGGRAVGGVPGGGRRAVVGGGGGREIPDGARGDRGRWRPHLVGVRRWPCPGRPRTLLRRHRRSGGDAPALAPAG